MDWNVTYKPTLCIKTTQRTTMTTKKEVTIGNLISISVTLFVLVLGWGVSMTSQMSVSDTKIENNLYDIKKNAEQIEKVDDKIDRNFKLIQDKLDKILFRSIKDE